MKKMEYVPYTVAGDEARCVISAVRNGPFDVASDGNKDLGALKLYLD
jgi:hypothetical protein